MITEQLITFETAKLAKEKGLTEGGLTWMFYEENGRRFNNEYEVGEQDYICCTQSQLQTWLRNKHQIHVNPEPYLESTVPGDTDVTGYYVGPIYNRYGKEICHVSDSNYPTYEEALEKGLQSALEFINYIKK